MAGYMLLSVDVTILDRAPPFGQLSSWEFRESQVFEVSGFG